MRVVLALCLAVLLAAPAALASERQPTLAELETEVMCPTCHTPLDQSDSPIADRIRSFIHTRIAAGDTKSEIKAKLVAQFGPAILTAPPKKGFNLLAWVLPIAGILAGAAVLAILAWRWSRARDQDGPGTGPGREGGTPLEPELERRLEEELARFE